MANKAVTKHLNGKRNRHLFHWMGERKRQREKIYAKWRAQLESADFGLDLLVLTNAKSILCSPILRIIACKYARWMLRNYPRRYRIQWRRQWTKFQENKKGDHGTSQTEDMRFGCESGKPVWRCQCHTEAQHESRLFFVPPAFSLRKLKQSVKFSAGLSNTYTPRENVQRAQHQHRMEIACELCVYQIL